MGSEKHKRLRRGRPVVAWQGLYLHAADWLVASFLTGLLLVSSSSAAVWQGSDLDATIQHLINYVRTSQVMFERNFSRHDATAAAAHIEKKYRHFREKIESPEQFIELCATASLVTGRPYMIIDAQGNEMPAAVWLAAELSRYRIQNANVE